MNSLRSALTAVLTGLFDPTIPPLCAVILSIELVQIISQALPIRAFLKAARRPNALTPFAASSKKPYRKNFLRDAGIAL
jgi:hypothetical protein